MEIINLTRGAIIAVVYVIITVLAAPISFGPFQFRLSEALTIFAYFEPAAIWGLYVGVFISNIFGGNGLPDILFGSLLTLVAAYITWKLQNPIIALIPPVLINAFGVAAILWFVIKVPYWPTVLTVGLGQFVVIYIIGLPLLLLILKNKSFIRDDVWQKKFSGGKNL